MKIMLAPKLYQFKFFAVCSLPLRTTLVRFSGINF